jgi:hypothetical protein
VADTAARKPLKRLTFARSARKTPLKQGVNEIWGEVDKGGMRPPRPTTVLLFFSGAAGGQFDRRARLAPLKNKKQEGGVRRGYKQATPSGV